MTTRTAKIFVLAMTGLFPLLTGVDCANIVVDLSDITSITVEVVNQTDFDVDPKIKYDDDEDDVSAAFPENELATGLLAPGEGISFTFDCDALGSIFSDEAEQFVDDNEIGEAEDSEILQRDQEYDCGDIIQFIFVGEGSEFGVITSVNGLIRGD